MQYTSIFTLHVYTLLNMVGTHDHSRTLSFLFDRAIFYKQMFVFMKRHARAQLCTEIWAFYWTTTCSPWSFGHIYRYLFVFVIFICIRSNNRCYSDFIWIHTVGFDDDYVVPKTWVSNNIASYSEDTLINDTW